MTQTVEYQKHYYAGSREELIAKVKEQVSEKRFKHILGVEQAALELALTIMSLKKLVWQL